MGSAASVPLSDARERAAAARRTIAAGLNPIAERKRNGGTGSGTTLTLITLPPDRRDPALSELAREAVIAAITTDAPAHVAPGPVGAAAALRAVLPQTDALTGPERALLHEWLDRVTRHATF